MLAFFVLGSGVFAQTDVGQEFIGEKRTGVVGIDNKLLLEADLDSLDMNYRIERIDEDGKYYYVTYTFLDLAEKDQVWQYQIQEKIRKVSKKSRVNLPKYLAEEFSEMYEARISYLREEQIGARMIGAERRVATEEYSGLIGKTLDVVASVFSKYDSVKTRELPSPTIPASILPARKLAGVVSTNDSTAVADSITNVYSDYIDRKDPDRDDIFGILDNCPHDYNPDQLDTDDDGVGDACASILNEELIINNEGNGEVASGTDEASDVATGTDAVVDDNIGADVDVEADVGGVDSVGDEASEDSEDSEDSDDGEDGGVEEADAGSFAGAQDDEAEEDGVGSAELEMEAEEVLGIEDEEEEEIDGEDEELDVVIIEL